MLIWLWFPGRYFHYLFD